MIPETIPEGLTFDDILLVPSRSSVVPADTDTRTWFTRNIGLNIPVVSSAMDTVTESHLAIALAQQGGIGIVHRNMSIDKQAEEVDRVKRSESGMIVDPVTIDPEHKISDALDVMKRYRISGVPVTKNGKLVGILTNRDLRFETRYDLPVANVMTKENLITVGVGTTLEEAEAILHTHRVEKLLVVDEHYNLKGLITVKDIQKKLKYPNAAKDAQGRLRVGAALGSSGDYLERAHELVSKKVDVLAIDSAHGHTQRVMDAIANVKRALPNVQLIAGNVATYEGAKELIDLGVDGIKVGIGPGSICTTRVVSGAGVPQITAIAECAKATAGSGVPLIADGGIKFSGDVTKAIAAGADCVMIGSLLAGTEESPGETILYQGRTFKSYRGHGVDGRDGARLSRPLLAGSHRRRQTGARRHRGPRALQRDAGRLGLSTGRRPARRHGLLRLRDHRRTPQTSQVPPRQRRRVAREPRPRRDHHQGSSELPVGVETTTQVLRRAIVAS